MTSRPQFLSVEAKIADLSFSEKWYFFLYFFLQNFHFDKSYGDLIFYECELRSETLGFKAIMNERNQGDPCTPEKLMAAGYDGDEFFTRETTVIFSELLSFQTFLIGTAQSSKWSSCRSKTGSPGSSLKSSSTGKPRSPNVVRSKSLITVDSLSTNSNIILGRWPRWPRQPT